ncbi:MAG TPA: DUF4340 domain-containing protein [Myxococcota bacterium]
MQPRTTAILLAVALALGAFVYFYEVGGEDARREAEEQTRRLFPGVVEEAVEWIALTTRDGIEARIERVEGGWRLVEPVEFPADRFAADGMAANLATLLSEVKLEDPQPLDEYGLGDAARTVRFAAAGEEHTLSLGRKTPVGANTYAYTGTAGAVYTVQTYKAQSFDKALDDLREKRILDFDTASIQRVEARWPDGRVVVERDAGAAEAEAGGWRMRSPLETRADDEVVDDLLSDLSFLRAKGFVDDPTGEAEAGFAPPSFEVTLTPRIEGDAPAAPIHLAVGGMDGGDRLVRGAHPSLYRIAGDRFEDFPRTLSAYRFKQLARFPVEEARQLELFFQPETGDPVAITAVLGDAGWTSSPETVPPDVLSRLVAELSRLRAADIAADAVGEDELRGLGLSPPNAILSVFGAAPEEGAEAGEPGAAPELAEVHIGGFYGPGGILARAAGDPIVYRLDGELAEHIPVNLEAFRSRFVDGGEAALDAPGDADEFLSPTQESP